MRYFNDTLYNPRRKTNTSRHSFINTFSIRRNYVTGRGNIVTSLNPIFTIKIRTRIHIHSHAHMHTRTYKHTHKHTRTYEHPRAHARTHRYNFSLIGMNLHRIERESTWIKTWARYPPPTTVRTNVCTRHVYTAVVDLGLYFYFFGGVDAFFKPYSIKCTIINPNT